MATQNDGFPAVNFSITSPFHNVRLVEVTDDILKIIEAGRTRKEKDPILKFKSAPSSTTSYNSSSNKAKDSVLHLCSDDRAWAIKQVSTSNSVYLIQPSIPTVTSQIQPDSNRFDEGGREPILDSTKGSVTATSQVRNFLELHAVQINELDIEAAIADLLPTHQNPDSADIDPVIQIQQASKPALNFDQLIANIASPDAIARKVCTQLGVFEDPSNGSRCYIPSASTLLAVWARITESSAIELIKLDHAINENRIIDTLPADTDKAIAHTMLRPNGMLTERGLFESTTVSDAQARYLKPQETCIFVATLLLRGMALGVNQTTPRIDENQVDIECEIFIRRWTDLVPSSFVKYCTLETLKSLTSVSLIAGSDGTEMVRCPVVSDGPLYLQPTGGATGSGGTTDVGKEDQKSSTTTTSANGKRKWHEKFGAQRNVKR